jgi:hypothetical protein
LHARKPNASDGERLAREFVARARPDDIVLAGNVPDVPWLRYHLRRAGASNRILYVASRGVREEMTRGLLSHAAALDEDEWVDYEDMPRLPRVRVWTASVGMFGWRVPGYEPADEEPESTPPGNGYTLRLLVPTVAI